MFKEMPSGAVLAAICVMAFATAGECDKNPAGNFFSKANGPLGMPKPTQGLPLGVPLPDYSGLEPSGLPSAFNAPIILPYNPAAPRLTLSSWTIKDKEKGTVVGTWTWDSTTQNFTADWKNGFKDTLRFDEYTDDHIVLSGINNYGVTMNYIGRRKGNTAEGTATINMPQGPWNWKWVATW